MAESVRAHSLYPPRFSSGSGFAPGPGGAMDPEGQPSILWGQGTPNGDLAPFNLVNKGSLYMAIDQTDDNACVYEKVDEGGDNNDWVVLMLAGDTGGNVLIEALEVNAKSHIVVLPTLVDISAADSEFIAFHAVAAVEITEIGLLWEEASQDDTGVHEGDVTIGTATGGAQVVAATLYGDNQAAGSYQALTLAEGTVAAGASLFVSHDQSTGTGTYRVILKYYLVS